MGELWKSLFVNLLLCTTGKDGHTVLLETGAAPGLNLSFIFHMTAVVGQQQMFLNEKGDDVYLPCGNVQTCDLIQWWYKAPWSSLLELIPLPAPGSTLNSRQMLRKDCTLVLLRVQDLDVGQYLCRLGSREMVQIYLAVVTSKYHSGLTGAGERCSLPPQSETLLPVAAPRGRGAKHQQ